MKLIKYLFFYAMITAIAVSCEKGLDPINAGDPGEELYNPDVEITFPIVGKNVVSSDSIATITFKFLATDDFELKSVVMQLDGNEIGNIASFKDYRRYNANFVFNDLRDGDHTFTVNVTDMSGKTGTSSVNFKKITAPTYTPLAGEVLYFPFDGSNLDLVTGSEAAVVGAPGFAEGKMGDAYAGATDSYITYPTTGILGEEFSVSFWHQLNAVPQRAGIFAISCGITNPDENRKFGFRLFRENDGDTKQKYGVNIGIGSAEVWMNPFTTVENTVGWVHIAVSITPTKGTIYVNGVVALENAELAGAIDWTGCSSISIGSGAPNFVFWEHFSDLSLIDDMHIFKKAITAEEVITLMGTKR